MPQIFPMNWILLTTNLMLSITCLMLILYFISFNYNNKFINKLEKKNNFNYQW
nr:ATP synthase F0 subunit 8 [Dermacentor sinicus]UNO54277.1 ATP synthase F0 subunit 8 [Dermacentor sinicus]